MKIEFSPTFSCDNGCYTYSAESFYAESSKEAFQKFKNFYDNDDEAGTFEDVYIEGQNVETDAWDFEFSYQTRFRNNRLDDEYNRLFKKLKAELKKLFKDE